MTRSSTNEIFTPFKDPKREFRSSRKHFKTLSLDELRSPNFDLFSNQEEYSEEEVAETMAKTMEQYMSKTRADYGSRIARPKIEDKDNQVMLRAFPMSLTGAASLWLRNEPTGSITNLDGLKTKFLNKYCPPARTTKKMKEINNFQQELDENLYQAWERFKELLMKYPQHYLTEMQEWPSKRWQNTLKNGTMEHLGQELDANNAKDPITPKIAHSKKKGKPSKKLTTQFGGPFQGGGYRAAALGFYQRNNANPSYQE
ncbi:hypothetical protein Tco_0228626 [Tanacetum coccineum]